jgi:hypothetical protein
MGIIIVVGPCAGGELPGAGQLRPSIIIVQAIHAIFSINSIAFLSIQYSINHQLSQTSQLTHAHTAIMVRHEASASIHQTGIQLTHNYHTVTPHRPSQGPRPANRPRPFSTLRPWCPRHTALEPIPQHTPQRLARLLSSRLLTPTGGTPQQLALHPRCPQDDHAAPRIRCR